MSGRPSAWRERHSGLVRRPVLQEYAEKYDEYFAMARRNGILEMAIHSSGGPALLSLGLKDAWHQVWSDVANDLENEVLILTGTGDAWIGGVEQATLDAFEGIREWPADMTYDSSYLDAVKLVERFVFDIEIPTIGVINGPGPRKELALFCDLTLCADHAFIGDGNFAAGYPAGDGMHLALQELVGSKVAAQYIYGGGQIDAATALRLGLVNEVLPGDRLLPRAWEIAEMIMERPRVARRLTHEIVQQPIRRRVFEDLRHGLSHVAFASGVL